MKVKEDLNINHNLKNPNMNIFQKENDYHMKKNLSFNDIEEKNCKKSHFIRNISLIKSVNVCIIIYNLIHLLFNQYNFSIMLIRLLVTILAYFTILLVENISKIITNIFSIRILVFLIDTIDLFLFCKENNYQEENNFFSMRIFHNVYLMTLIHNYCFCLNLSESFHLYLLITNELLLFYDYPDNWFIIRFFKNLFSLKIISIIYLIMLSIIIQYNMEKPVRRLWALFDSYKKSYFCVKMIYDKFQFGVMVVKKDLSIIFYKNSKAEKFHTSIKGCFPGKCKCTFKDIFNLNNPSYEKLFLEEIKNGIIKKSTFIFPILINKPVKDGEVIKNETSKKFIELYAYNCEWTNKEECYYIQIHKIPFISNGGLIALENLSKIQKEMTSFVWNLNQICSFAPLKPEESKRDSDKNLIFLNNIPEKSPNKSPSNWKPRHIMQKKNYRRTPLAMLNSKKKISFNVSPSPGKSPNFIGLLEEMKLKNLIKKKTQFDYTFLFYNRFGGNYIYDLALTNYVFTSFIENKEIKDIRRFNFDNFLNYMVNYLTPIAKINNFTIEVKNSLKEEVEANYTYIRVILFNCIMFILNNSKDQKNKTLEIRMNHVKFNKSNENYYRLVFQFNQVHSYYSYKHLSTFFSQFDEAKFKNIDPQQINNTIDLGLFVVFLICNIVFNCNDINSFEIKTNPYQILSSIYIPSSLNNPNIKYKKFPILDINSDISRKANEKIAAIHYENYIDKINIEDSEDNRYDTRAEEELITEEENYFVKNDKKFAMESNIQYVFGKNLSENFENVISAIQEEKLERNKNNEESIIFLNENEKDKTEMPLEINKMNEIFDHMKLFVFDK